MQESLSFFLNGEEYFIKTNASILEILQYFNYHDALFVLEHNNSISNRKNWETTQIKNQDQIEIVTIVGGG